MSERLSEQAAGIGALAEPTRSALYLFVAGQPDAVSRDQAAQGVRVALHTAKFHLDRLVDEGLLDVEFRRLSGRTGPGAGRPAKLYRRSARQLSVSLPERRYDLVGHILAAGVERSQRAGTSLHEAVAEAAEDCGRRAAHRGPAPDAGASADTGVDVGSDAGVDVARACAVLADQGYEPARRGDEVVLANCPFDALAREHTELVCGLNEAFVRGVLDGVGCSGTEARLDPEDGLCCVKVRLPEDARLAP